MIVDAHAHIFPVVDGRVGQGATSGLGYGRIAVGEETRQLLPPYNAETIFTPEMLVANMDWAGVDLAVLLQGPFYGSCNQYVLEALEKYPDRLRGTAYFDPWASDSQVRFQMIAARTGFCGIKLECSVATGFCGIYPQARLDAPELNWLWKALEKRNWVLTLDLGAVGSRSYQTEAVRRIAEQHPGLKVVIVHLGQPRPEAEAKPSLWRLWLEQIELGRLPNVWFDTSALPAYLPDESYPFPTAGRYLRTVLERIGPARIMWGTDQPGLLSRASYPQLVDMARSQTDFLTVREQTIGIGRKCDAGVRSPLRGDGDGRNCGWPGGRHE